MAHIEVGVETSVAIVGMGCRFPGGITCPAEYWDFLVAGCNATREVPADRWVPYLNMSDAQAGAARNAIRYGAYLDRIDEFDAEFFGISPREAALMDPQQRMSMEVAWEALEHAGIDPLTLAGSDSGVFMGTCCDDYGRRLLEDLPGIEAWTGIGSSLCAVANRVSYALDLRGPSVVVDTACSASLVAMHQACQALRLGETSLAIAGGVMLVAGPSFALALDAAGALSPDGRCKSFDASADGYGRGEGCGVLVLKRLADAQRDGDRVLGVILGSAVAQDGRTDGIMAPSQHAQENLLRIACRNARVAPVELDYIEAHGTGTCLGDPIEVRALSAVAGVGRPADQPCLIGSVKANIGHLEAASGVAGVIKAVLALWHGVIPATPVPTGVRQDIPWADLGLDVVTDTVPWPETGRPRRAGVGNYGYGGTLAHVVLEQAPPVPSRPVDFDDERIRIYPLSGASDANLSGSAGRLAEWVDAHDDVPLDSVAHTLTHRRAALPVRATVVAAGRAALALALRRLADDRPTPTTSTGRRRRDAVSTGPVWVFSGHGSQWVGMGRELLDTEPELGEVLDELTPVYRSEMGYSPKDYLLHGDMSEVDKVQSMIFALQVGLARIWQRMGVRPAAVIGHSVGEIAAAVTAGMLDLPDAALLICRRSVLLRRVAGQGAMAMVNVPFEHAQERLAGQDAVCAAIAAAPGSTVLSGPTDSLAHVLASWSAELEVRPIDSDVAFHSPQMDEILAGLRAAAASITAHTPLVPVYSTAMNDPRSDALRDADYWAANLRRPVRLNDAVAAAVQDGHRTFVEVSPHPVVAHSITETLADLGVTDAVVVPTLRRNRPERTSMLTSLGSLHCAGMPVDWTAVQATGGLCDLPTMSWRHRRCWVDPTGRVEPEPQDARSHTLLGGRTNVQTGRAPITLWQTHLDDATRPYSGRHAVLGVEVLPAAATLTTFLAAADFAALSDVALRVPVTIDTPRSVQVVRADGTVRMSSKLYGDVHDRSWLTHAWASMHADARMVDRRMRPSGRDDCAWSAEPASAVADLLSAIGVVGLGFPWRVDDLLLDGGALLATVTADPDGGPASRTWGSLLDASLSVAPVLFPGEPMLRMPCELATVAVAPTPPAVGVISVLLVDLGDDGQTTVVDIDVADTAGNVVATLAGVRFGAVDHQAAPAQADDEATESLLELSAPELPADVLGVVCEVAAGEIGVDEAELDARAPLAELGADSVILTAIRRRLEKRFGIPMPTNVLWNRPSAAALADYVTDHVCVAVG